MFYEGNRSNLEKYIYHQEDVSLNFPIHFHNSFEFFLVLEGDIELLISEKYYTIHNNQAVLIFPNQPHSYKTTEYSKTYLCVFSKDFVWAFSDKYSDYMPVNPIFEITDSLKIYTDLINAKDIFMQKSILYYLVSRIYNNSVIEKQKSKLTSFIHDTIQYIQSNLTSDITLSSLSKYLGYGYNYTSTLFNKTFKVSFSDLLNDYRIAYAVDLLKNTDMSITEVSISCGYNTIRSFNRNFIAKTKLVPSSFRNAIDEFSIIKN